MNQVQLYRRIYLISIPVGIITLLLPWVESIYALMFFGSTIFILFAKEQVKEDPSHSTVTHYERSSRWNWFNYALSGMLIFAALLFVFSPIGRTFTLFILWSTYVIAINFLHLKYHTGGGEQLIADYIQSQMPDLTTEQVKEAVTLFSQNPTADIAARLQLPPEKVDQIRHYYKTYKHNNLDSATPV